MSDEEARARRARARTRQHWAGAIMSLDDQPEIACIDAPPGVLVGMVKELTLAAWAMRRALIPDYARSEAPGRMIRAEDVDD